MPAPKPTPKPVVLKAKVSPNARVALSSRAKHRLQVVAVGALRFGAMPRARKHVRLSNSHIRTLLNELDNMTTKDDDEMNDDDDDDDDDDDVSGTDKEGKDNDSVSLS